MKMEVFLVLLAVSASHVVAQTADACSAACMANVRLSNTPGCHITDYACLCANSKFVSEAYDCIYKQCDSFHISKALDKLALVCNIFVVNIDANNPTPTHTLSTRSNTTVSTSTITVTHTGNPSPQDAGISKGTIVGISVGATVGVVLLVAAGIFFFQKSSKQRDPSEWPLQDPAMGIDDSALAMEPIYIDKAGKPGMHAGYPEPRMHAAYPEPGMHARYPELDGQFQGGNRANVYGPQIWETQELEGRHGQNTAELDAIPKSDASVNAWHSSPPPSFPLLHSPPGPASPTWELPATTAGNTYSNDTYHTRVGSNTVSPPPPFASLNSSAGPPPPVWELPTTSATANAYPNDAQVGSNTVSNTYNPQPLYTQNYPYYSQSEYPSNPNANFYPPPAAQPAAPPAPLLPTDDPQRQQP